MNIRVFDLTNQLCFDLFSLIPNHFIISILIFRYRNTAFRMKTSFFCCLMSEFKHSVIEYVAINAICTNYEHPLQKQMTVL